MTCKDLGGACDHEFVAETFDEMAELSKQHGKTMFEQNDAAHLNAMQEMGKLMQNPSAMQQWFAEKQALFNELPDID